MGSVPQLSIRSSATGPKVSLVMPTYGRSHQIGETLRSLLAQSFSDFELLIRDDGDGADGKEKAVVAACGGDSRVRYHRNEHRLGIPGNTNSGIVETQGELISVCHDHDLYREDYIEQMVKGLERNRSALFVHCSVDVIRQDGDFVQSHIGNWPELSGGTSWLRFMLRSLHCPVCALTVVRRDAHERYGLYDPRYGFVADVEMWMRLSQHGDVAFLAAPLIQVREREPGHAASSNWATLLRTVAAIHRTYSAQEYCGAEYLYRRLLLESRLSRQLLVGMASQVKRSFRAKRLELVKFQARDGA